MAIFARGGFGGFGDRDRQDQPRQGRGGGGKRGGRGGGGGDDENGNNRNGRGGGNGGILAERHKQVVAELKLANAKTDKWGTLNYAQLKKLTDSTIVYHRQMNTALQNIKALRTSRGGGGGGGAGPVAGSSGIRNSRNLYDPRMTSDMRKLFTQHPALQQLAETRKEEGETRKIIKQTLGDFGTTFSTILPGLTNAIRNFVSTSRDLLMFTRPFFKLGAKIMTPLTGLMGLIGRKAKAGAHRMLGGSDKEGAEGLNVLQKGYRTATAPWRSQWWRGEEDRLRQPLTKGGKRKTRRTRRDEDDADYQPGGARDAELNEEATQASMGMAANIQIMTDLFAGDGAWVRIKNAGDLVGGSGGVGGKGWLEALKNFGLGAVTSFLFRKLLKEPLAWIGRQLLNFTKWSGQKLLDLARWSGQKISNLARWGGEKVVELSKWGGEKISNLARWGGEKISNLARWGGDKVAELSRWGGQKLLDFGTDIGSKLKGFGTSLADEVGRGLSRIGGALADFGTTLRTTLGNITTEVSNALKGIPGKIAEWFRKPPPISRPPISPHGPPSSRGPVGEPHAPVRPGVTPHSPGPVGEPHAPTPRPAFQPHAPGTPGPVGEPHAPVSRPGPAIRPGPTGPKVKPPIKYPAHPRTTVPTTTAPGVWSRIGTAWKTYTPAGWLYSYLEPGAKKALQEGGEAALRALEEALKASKSVIDNGIAKIAPFINKLAQNVRGPVEAAGTKVLAKIGTRAAGILLKAIPPLAFAFGCYWAYERAMAGDWVGAGIQFVIALTNLGGWISMAIGLGLEALLYVYDKVKAGDYKDLPSGATPEYDAMGNATGYTTPDVSTSTAPAQSRNPATGRYGTLPSKPSTTSRARRAQGGAGAFGNMLQGMDKFQGGGGSSGGAGATGVSYNEGGSTETDFLNNRKQFDVMNSLVNASATSGERDEKLTTAIYSLAESVVATSRQNKANPLPNVANDTAISPVVASYALGAV